MSFELLEKEIKGTLHLGMNSIGRKFFYLGREWVRYAVGYGSIFVELFVSSDENFGHHIAIVTQLFLFAARSLIYPRNA